MQGEATLCLSLGLSVKGMRKNGQSQCQAFIRMENKAKQTKQNIEELPPLV